MLNIGVSDLTNANVHDMNIERSTFTVSHMTRTPLSDTRCNTKSLHAEGLFGLWPSNIVRNSSDVSGLAREIPPSEDGRNSTSLNVRIDIVGEEPNYSGLDLHNARKVVSLNTG